MPRQTLPRALLLSTLLALTALAAPQKPTSTRKTNATLAVTPNPTPAGSPIKLRGCGYTPSSTALFQDLGTTTFTQWSTQTDPTGCVETTRAASIEPGAHEIQAYQYNSRNRLTLIASTNLTITPQPLTLVAETYRYQWSSTKGCTGEDDQLDWKAAGYLDAGKTFTFSPTTPECDTSRAVMVEVRTTKQDAALELYTTVPAADAFSNNPAQAGTPIRVTAKDGVARICMFPDLAFKPPTGYTIAVRNLGSARIDDVTLSGSSRNDWQALYYSFCERADADQDGASDSFEHTMAQLIYPTGNFNYGNKPAGADYLRDCGTPTPGDEFDPWPLDLDDDGVITQFDVNAVDSNVGQGNDVPWTDITPEQNDPLGYWSHVGEWNRYDLNADGLVSGLDVDLVKQRLGARCQ